MIAAPVASTLNAAFGSKLGLEDQHINSGAPLFVAHSPRGDGLDASEDGTGRGTPLAPVLRCHACGNVFSDPYGTAVDGLAPFECDQCGEEARLAPIAFDALAGGDTGFAVGDVPGAPHGVGRAAVACDLRGREGGALPEGPHETANIRAASGGSSRSYLATPWVVRRLTPMECERLQGFPDGYTQVPYRGRSAADGPRYKALGNSMAVNVMDWIGQRVALVDEIIRRDRAA